MISGLPNFAFAVGYTNASWTLRADLTSRLVCKVLRLMDARGYDCGGAAAPPGTRRRNRSWICSPATSSAPRPLLPKQGTRAPWRMRQNYVLDAATTMRTDLRRYLKGTQVPARSGR